MSMKTIITIAVAFLLFVICCAGIVTAFVLSNKPSPDVSLQTKQEAIVQNEEKSSNDKVNTQKDKNLQTVKLDDGTELTAGIVSDVAIAVVNAAELKNPVGNKFHLVTPKGKHIAVAVMVINGQKDAITFNEGLFTLVNKDNKEYSTDTKAMTAWQITHDEGGIFEQINPDMTTAITCIFDVPEDSKVSDYCLKARAGMLGGTVVVPFNYIKRITFE